MNESLKYTKPKKRELSLTSVAKRKNISRKLLFKLMEEEGLIKVTPTSKKLTSKKYGFTTHHASRTAIYIYEHKIDELFEKIKIPAVKEYQRICFKCRMVKGIKAFKERMAVCMVCKQSLKEKEYEEVENLKEDKDGINPFYLNRGLKHD